MRDDAKPVDSEIKFDPANPNNGPMLRWDADPVLYGKACTLAARLSQFINHASFGRTQIPPSIIGADLICLHCNGRLQDFDAWGRAQIEEAAREYALVYVNIDRRTGKLPDFVRLKFDKR